MIVGETIFSVYQSAPTEQQERFLKMLGVVPAKLGKPNLNHLPPKTVIVEQMAQVITSQARRNKEKATRQSGY